MELSNGVPIPVSGLFSFGDNSEGNLGTQEVQGENPHSATPLPIEIALPVRFVSVAAGLFHSLALTGTLQSMLCAYISSMRMECSARPHFGADKISNFARVKLVEQFVDF